MQAPVLAKILVFDTNANGCQVNLELDIFFFFFFELDIFFFFFFELDIFFCSSNNHTYRILYIMYVYLFLTFFPRIDQKP